MTQTENTPTELFSVTQCRQKTGRHPLELTLADRVEMSQEDLNSILFHANATHAVATLEQLSEAVSVYVHLNSLEARPVTLSRLNRIFGRLASRLGPGIRALIERLTLEDRVMPFVRTGTSALVSPPVWRALPAFLSEQGIEQDTPEWDGVLDAWAANTVK